ncbi:metalloprotease ATP23 [Hesseltinella vesiculosa]|uniref:Mitochondrial inner membrane protease ATP23 n=1 Tax=Hesseltinella vesiculosa TaxID=101127 RepID=A0A1X2GKS4_9FUNG|nr:metalloprotease ATP23 [Hesseltinella vesiculosa]
MADPVETNDASPQEMKRFERWTKSLKYLTGLGMTEQERKEFRDQIDVQMEDHQCRQCEVWKKTLIKNNPPVRFMMDELHKIGKSVDEESFKCVPCDETRAGGFSPDEGIILCHNRLASKGRQEETMVHEMVHMYDNHKFKVNWTDLNHHACSEIRAASLSGDCRWTNEIRRGFYTFTKQHQACVKRRAILSVQQNPHCHSKEEAEQAVNSVFESCFADTRPFDEIY